MNKELDPNDFQGKSRRQVETSYRILAFCIVAICLVFTWGLVYKIIKMIF